MAITLGSNPLWRPITLTQFDKTNERVTKSFNIDPTVSDAIIIAALTAYEGLNNAKTTKGRLAGREILGMRNSVVNASYDLIGVGAVLTFTQTSPENSELTLYKEFIIPAPVATLFESDNVSIITPDSGGSAVQIKLDTLVSFCQDYLVAFIKSANVAVVGGWLYKPLQSGLITSLRKYDGQIG